MVFLHGWSQSASAWRSIVRSLSGSYRCVVMDLRGHGRSAAPDDGYAMERLVSDLTGLLDHLSLQRPAVIGWSLGAMVAVAAFPALREKLSSLVLVAGTPKFSSTTDYPFALSPKEPRVLGLRLKRDPERTWQDFFRGMFTTEERSSSHYEKVEKEFFVDAPRPSRHGAARSLETLATADLRGVLDTVDVPVLLVHGSGDPICPVGASRFMAERIPGAVLHELDGAGHAPMLSRTVALSSILDKFLEGVYEGDR